MEILFYNLHLPPTWQNERDFERKERGCRVIERGIYMSQLKAGAREVFMRRLSADADEWRDSLSKDGVIIALSVFIEERLLFIYREARKGADPFAWPASYRDWLALWPGQAELRDCVSMLDIFHDGIPGEQQDWRGGRQVEQRIGAVTRLKPDWYSSYVYYHYQAQEERPESFNKTYMIGAHGNTLFSYCELPATFSACKPERRLTTHQTPDNWHETMAPHFLPESGETVAENAWKALTCIFHT